TLRFLDCTFTSGEVSDLGDVVLAPFVTFLGKVEDADGKPVAGARVRASLLPAIVFQPGVADVARATAILPDRTQRTFGPPIIEFPASVRAWESMLPFPTTRTDEAGAFKLAGVPQGLATLVVDADGYTGTTRGPTPTGKKAERDVGTIELARGRTI